MIDLDAIASHASTLLAAAPRGPYEAWHPDDMPDRSLVVGGSERGAPYDAFAAAVEGKDRVAIAEMLAASHGLATQTLALVRELRRLTAPVAASDLTPEQRAACWQVIDRHREYLARRGELCTCGSGAHPRECARHSHAYTAHLAELNAQSQADTLAEQAADIDLLRAENEHLRRRLADEDGDGTKWLELDFEGPRDGTGLRLREGALPDLVTLTLDKAVNRVADGCDRVVLRLHLINGREIPDGTVLLRVGHDESGNATATVHDAFKRADEAREP